MRQSEQHKGCEEVEEIGKENFETIEPKIGGEGWPSLECQEASVAFEFGAANYATAWDGEPSHS